VILNFKAQLNCPSGALFEKNFTCTLTYINSLTNAYLNVNYGDQSSFYSQFVSNNLTRASQYISSLQAPTNTLLLASQEFVNDSNFSGLEIYSEDGIGIVSVYVLFLRKKDESEPIRIIKKSQD
jgi:hypothetical protein